jgi:hypothetical protein
MNKFVLASLLGAAVMFAGQAPATSSKAQTSSQPAPATTTKVKKHHKKGKKAPVSTTSANSKPAAKQ